MFKKVNGNTYESDNGYVVEFQTVEGSKAALVGKKEDNGNTRLLFIVSAEGITRNKFLTHLEENFDQYLDKYAK